MAKYKDNKGMKQISFFEKLTPEQKVWRCGKCLYYISHRCRNNKECPDQLDYIRHTGYQVRQCLFATTAVYQDGYIHCPILESYGCEWCFERFEKEGKEPYCEDQNYDVDEAGRVIPAERNGK